MAASVFRGRNSLLYFKTLSGHLRRKVHCLRRPPSQLTVTSSLPVTHRHLPSLAVSRKPSESTVDVGNVTDKKKDDGPPTTTIKDVGDVTDKKKDDSTLSNAIKSDVDVDADFREQHIALSLRTIVQRAMQQRDLLSSEEAERMESLVLALDLAVVNHYRGVATDLIKLFEPLDATAAVAPVGGRLLRWQQADSEFWLLQRLADVMAAANFHELSAASVRRALSPHATAHGTVVSVDADRYDLLRFWVLGRQAVDAQTPWYERLAARVARQAAPPPPAFYRRVVIATRLKRDDRVMLKSFREVPTDALAILLPDGEMTMTRADRALTGGLGVLTAVSGVAAAVASLAGVSPAGPLVAAAVGAAGAGAAVTRAARRQTAYVAEHARTLYFRGADGGATLLRRLMSRAEQELLKQTVLVYVTLLGSRAAGADQAQEQIGSLLPSELDARVRRWLTPPDAAGPPPAFRGAAAVALLTELGVAGVDAAGRLHVLPLPAALRNLPVPASRLAARWPPRDDEDEPSSVQQRRQQEAEFRREAETRRSYGWFRV